MGNVVTMNAVVPNKEQVQIGPIKNNKWVTYDGKIGIVTDLEEDKATFNAVGFDGLTYLSMPVNPMQLVLAKYSEIPLVRRPTAETAHALGYEVDTLQ